MINNLKINEVLGAKIFQKCVFKVEDVKYSVIDKFFPNLAVKYEEKMSCQLEEALKDVNTEEQRQEVINNYRDKVLTLKRELNGRKNRNYHISVDNPSKFVKYLNYNKSIHLKALVRNGVVFLITTTGIVLGNEIIQPFAYAWFGYNCISTFINFQCVNLQNYNLKRFNNSMEKLEMIAKKKQDRDIKCYGEISKVISEQFQATDKIPDTDDIVQQITTKTQLEQMRKLLKDNMYSNKESKSNKRVKKKTIKEG